MSALTAPEIILRPVISEKSIDESGRGKYTFAVSDRANKIQIKAAIEELYKKENVTVVSVNVLTTKAKEKRRGNRRGQTIGHHAVAQGHRDPGARPEDRILRRGLTDAASQLQGHLAGAPADDSIDLRGDHDQGAHKPLLEPQIRGSGAIARAESPTVRHQGWVARSSVHRRIDFKRDKLGVPARLATIEDDPNRSGRIGLLHYRDGEKRYMLLPHGLKVGDVVVAGPEAEARIGNALPLANIPLGTTIHNIELVPGKGGQIVRSAAACRLSCWPRKASSPPSGFRRARCVASRCAAWPRWPS